MIGRYPDQPGCRAGSPQTSLLAALNAAQTAPRAIDLILSVLSAGPHSPEELQSVLAGRGHTLLLTSIRARCTQLKAQGRVRDSGEKGIGESLRSKVIRWRLATPAETAEFLAARDAEADHD